MSNQVLKDKESYVHNLFSRIAKSYDSLNDIMTFSLHRSWKKDLVRDAAKGIKTNNAKILDLCTGTGDIADLWIDDQRVTEIIALDSCAPMLESGFLKLRKKYKGDPPKVHMIEGDAQVLPFDDNSFDAVTIGFGLRNVKDPDACISEIYRVLKPGAYFACLDLGHPHIPLIDLIYKNIFLVFIPWLGSLFAKDKAAYQYLVDSLKTWPPQQKLSAALYDFGFKRSYYQDIMLGTIAIVVAEK